MGLISKGMEKIKEYRIRQYGKRGHAITLPKVWIKDNKLVGGEVLEFLRETTPEYDRLIIQKKRNDE